jgi:hypothetical protein
MRRSTVFGSAAAACAAVVLGSCSGVPELTPITTYGSANAFTPSGYSQTKIDDTHYKVKAAGTEATPKSRIEKIARARAAEIGVQEKQKYFKVTGVAHSVACTSAQSTYKGGKVPASARPTVELDVVYADEPTDAEFVEAKTSFESLSQELANETVPPEAKATAIQETRASCGQG